jgi:hypothetical protein
MELVSQLQHCLSKTLKEWKRFSSATGDISYFANIDYSGATWPSRTRMLLSAIKQTFENLEYLQETLHNLLTSCHYETKAVSPSLFSPMGITLTTGKKLADNRDIATTPLDA